MFNHIDFIDVSQDINDCSSIEKRFLDFHVLAECDAAVISRSQFGRMGILRRNQPAKHVNVYNSTLDELIKIKDMNDFKLR